MVCKKGDFELANFIHVNHSKFETTATAIDNYIAKHKKNMTLANQEVTTLSSNKQKKDYTEFQNQWNKVTEQKSTSQEMIKALENYAAFLRYAGKQYKDAQIDAVNRAKKIWF